MTQLPAVASNFHHYCKKCEADRYHKVLAHPTSTTAKIECEVCHKKSTFKLESEKKPKAVGVKKAAAKAKSSRSSHVTEFESIKSQMNPDKALGYNMKVGFQINQTVSHPKFGMGFIKAVTPEKIEVLFEDEARLLVHNRG